MPRASITGLASETRNNSKRRLWVDVLDYDLASKVLAVFKPPERLPPSEWAEQNIILPEESNAEPGPLELAPYQRGLVDAIADENANTLVFMLASQTGKSLSIDCALGYAMAVDPGPVLHVSPTEGKAVDFVRNRLDPLIRRSPALRKIVGGGRKGGGDSLTHKLFPGGSLNRKITAGSIELPSNMTRKDFTDIVKEVYNDNSGVSGCMECEEIFGDD